MGEFTGRTAFVTGAARGRGRSHAAALAREGANVVGVDLCRQLDTVAYPMSAPRTSRRPCAWSRRRAGRCSAWSPTTRSP